MCLEKIKNNGTTTWTVFAQTYLAKKIIAPYSILSVFV